MAVKKEIKRYSDWSGGHWGRLGAFKAPDNMYRSVNLQVYSNGTLGPRPGWKKLTTTGDAPAPAAGSGSEFYGMLWVPSSDDGGYLLFVSKSDTAAIKKLDMDTFAWSDVNFDGPVNDMILAGVGAGNLHSFWEYYAMVGGTRYVNMLLDTQATISYPDSFSPRASVVYKSRMYSWGDTSVPGRIYYSDAGDFFTFNSGQNFDVGNSQRTVVHCWALKDSLIVLSLAGAINGKQLEAEWWQLQGANPITGTFRKLASGEWPWVPEHVAQVRDNLLWLDSLYDHGIFLHSGTELDTVSLGRLVPRSAWDSALATSTRKPITLYGQPGVVTPYVIGSSWADSTADVIGDNYENGLQGWELVNGTWTKASYWNGAKEPVLDDGRDFLWGTSPWAGDKLIFATNDSADGSGTYSLYVRNICLNRPAVGGDTHSSITEEHDDVASSGEGLDCRLWLTPVQADEGSGVRVTKVVVDFDYWQNSGYYSEGAALKAKILNYRQNRGWSGETEELTADLSILEDSTDRMPGRGRYVFRFPDSGWYSASQVYFTSMRNVAIDQVAVHFDRNPQEPV